MYSQMRFGKLFALIFTENNKLNNQLNFKHILGNFLVRFQGQKFQKKRM